MVSTLAAAETAAPVAQLLDFRIGVWPDRLRLVFEADQPMTVEQRYAERRLELLLSGVEAERLTELIAARPPSAHRLILSYALQQRGSEDWLLTLRLAESIEPKLWAMRPQGGHQHRWVLDLHYGGQSSAVVSLPSEAEFDQPLDLPDQAPPSAVAPPPTHVVQAQPTLKPDVPSRLAVRLGRWPDRTRLVIETDRPLPFGLRSAAEGEQLSLRLQGLSADALRDALADAGVASTAGIVSAQVHQSQADVQLELELSSRSRLRAFNLLPENGYRHRLVLDLLTLPALVAVVAEGATNVAAPHKESATPLGASRPLEPAAAAPQTTYQAAVDELVWLETRLNQQLQQRTVLVMRQQERLLLGADDLRYWRLRLPEEADVQREGQRWFALDRLGITQQLDPAASALALQAPAELFDRAALRPPRQARLPPTPAPLGGFVNYDISANDSAGQVSAGGVFEFGVFNPWGSLTSSALWNQPSADDDYRWLRLDTAFRRDDPDRMRSLVIGDSINRSTSFSGAVRFAGLQWGRNFATQPDFLSLPTLGLSGEASLPSVVELYVNEALRLRQEVAPGPFSIEQIPVVTGQGDVRLVVRDALGREQVISQEFYAAQQLLRQGLHDWSWELGAVREDFGLENAHYGRGLISTTHRYGINDHWTGELHAQWLQGQRMGGLGTVWQLPVGGTLQAAAAVSDSTEGQGEFYSLGAQRQGDWISAGIEAQHAGARFRRLGMAADDPLPSRQLRAFASTRLPGGASLSLAWTDQRNRQRDDLEFYTLRFSRALGWVGFLSLSALYYPLDRDTALSASISIPLGRHGHSLAIDGYHQADRSNASVQLQRSLPIGSGYGYDLQLGIGEQARHRAGLAMQNGYGLWQLDAAYADNQMATRAGARGALVMLQREWFATRAVRDSLALVRVPGHADVRVYADNQVVARTNAEGQALVPSLRAYQRNRLRIEQADLPLGVRVNQLEQDVAPYWRSGVAVEFAAVASRDALFRVVLEDGAPLPLDAVLEYPRGKRWPVGYRGEVFVTGLASRSELHARFAGRECAIVLQVPDDYDNPLPDLGSVVCRESHP